MMRAMVVADDLSPLADVEHVLARRGWNVARVAGVGAVVDSFQRAEPRLVVIEEDSTGTGSEICRELRESVHPPPYVIGIAWRHDRTALRRLAQAGVDDVIGAPFEPWEAETRVLLAEARIGAPEHPNVPDPDYGRIIDEIKHRLQIQQAFLEGLFESAPEGIVVLDQQNRIVRINSEFTRVFGYSLAEAAGQQINELIVPESLGGEGDELDEVVRRGERVMVETVRKHRDGRLIDVSVLATPIEVNGPVGVISIYRDISDKKRHEAALRESEARYRALFDQSPIGVFLCDRGLRITHCNEYLTRLVGVPYEQIVGANLLALRSSRLVPGLQQALNGEPTFYEGPYQTPTGKELHISAQYAPMRSDAGEVIGGIGVLEDISQRVSAEKKLREQAAEMERVNAELHERTLELEAAIKARSRLYSAMNHELRTPISGIMLYQELLLAETLGPLTPDQHRALDHSHTAAHHLLDLVSDILDLGKLEAGKVGIEPVRIRVDELLAEVHASVAPLAERYGTSLTIEHSQDVVELVTDPQRLRQILTNFVSNAAKYGRSAPVVVRCGQHPSGVAFEVIDQGIGIAEENLEGIFDEFVQLESGGKEGTGLGLAICRRLAQLLGARLEVESKLNVGSTFRVIVPDEQV